MPPDLVLVVRAGLPSVSEGEGVSLMSGWVWIVIVLGLLLSVGLITDWRRRHSGGGSVDSPGASSHPGGAGGHSGGGYGGGCGGGGP